MSQRVFARRQTLQSSMLMMAPGWTPWQGDAEEGLGFSVSAAASTSPMGSSRGGVDCWSCPILDCVAGLLHPCIHRSLVWVPHWLRWLSQQRAFLKGQKAVAQMPTLLPAARASSLSLKGHLTRTFPCPPLEVLGTYLKVPGYSVTKRATAHQLGRMVYYFGAVRNRNCCLW